MLSKLGKNLQGRTIAVYGASSNIGRKFTQEAARRGAVVIAVARNISKVTTFLKKDSTGNIEAVKADITKKEDVYKALHGRNVYATVNFAADFSQDYSKSKTVNVYGEQLIIDASIQYGVKRHIYISTIATLIPKPNAYRDTKLKAEDAVKASGKRQLDWVILRYAHVLGTPTWDQPFKLILPFLKIGIPKVPTDAKSTAFPYATIDTVIDATIEALDTRPNQTITILDGKITIGKYLSTMEKIYHIRKSFLPSRLLQILDKLIGKYFPAITSMAAVVGFLAHPPMLENNTMKQELKIKTRTFQQWIETHQLDISLKKS